MRRMGEKPSAGMPNARTNLHMRVRISLRDVRVGGGDGACDSRVTTRNATRGAGGGGACTASERECGRARTASQSPQGTRRSRCGGPVAPWTPRMPSTMRSERTRTR